MFVLLIVIAGYVAQVDYQTQATCERAAQVVQAHGAVAYCIPRD